MKIWIYQPRNASPEAYYHFEDARRQQDEDNRVTLEELIGDGLVPDGSEEEGYFYIDDGGSIELVEVK